MKSVKEYDFMLSINRSKINSYKKIQIKKNRYIETDEDILDDMDFKIVESYVRKKKLENINSKN